MQALKIKRGDTFSIDAVVIGDDVPIVGGIAAWTISCVIKTRASVLVDTLAFTLLDAVACTYRLTESEVGVTSSWPLDELQADIKYVIGATVVHTERFFIQVNPSVTP